MSALRSSRGFRIALIAAAVLLIVEGVVIFLSYQTVQREERRAKSLRRDLASMQHVSPAPTEAIAMKIEDEVAAYEARQSWETKLQGGTFPDRLAAEPVPKERTDAYFDLVGYAERLRTLANRQGVQIVTEEYFGFADFAKEGPEANQIGTIFRQRHILEETLRQLLLSQPVSLISVERGGGSDTDEWKEPSRLSLAVPEVLATEFVRIRFTGETSSLRAWLNRLSEHHGNPITLPVSVRSVEVQPVRNNERRSSSRGTGASLVLTSELPVVAPLVERGVSEFTVILEMLEIVTPNQEDDQ